MGELKSSLRFINYIVEKVEFYNNPESKEETFKIDFDIDSSVNFIDDNKFLLNLDVKIFENAKENGYPFSMNVSITGMFEIDNVDNKVKHIFAEKNAVAIIFPYVRALVSTYTSISNVQPIILPPINVAKYIEDKKGK